MFSFIFIITEPHTFGKEGMLKVLKEFFQSIMEIIMNPFLTQ